MELTMARYWSTLGRTDLRVDLHFRGVVPHPEELALGAGEALRQIRLEARLRTVEVSPAGSLTKWWHKVHPASATVGPLGERDVMNNGAAVSQLVLQYDFDQYDEQDVTPRFPGLNGVLYESGLESQFWIVVDASNKVLGSGDAWPGSVSLRKGKHSLRLYVRHESVQLLEGMKGTMMMLERPLKGKAEVKLSFYSTKEDLVTRGPTASPRRIEEGTDAAVFAAEPAPESIPKRAKPGDVLFGTVTYEKRIDGMLGARVRPGGFPVVYLVGPSPSSSSSSSS
eukprot:CAMPEP_0198440462 /NCGR_PEP_ID=MMETSP1452-20131203/58859_1 /TAXON_ID=1181717 /ORGANISM="Synchroma pusillum, Strain CCMP3072" /LENGTH=281 /DNA_ID=CAMNT_0044161081 /DNA_START=94 /DNA_END=936 /DNA_ORIENTATION=+